MRYNILKDGEIINTIVASEGFCAAYCQANGYTCEEDLLPEPEETDTETTIYDELDAAYQEGVDSV